MIASSIGSYGLAHRELEHGHGAARIERELADGGEAGEAYLEHDPQDYLQRDRPHPRAHFSGSPSGHVSISAAAISEICSR